jgi:hypothetical protein
MREQDERSKHFDGKKKQRWTNSAIYPTLRTTVAQKGQAVFELAELCTRKKKTVRFKNHKNVNQ